MIIFNKNKLLSSETNCIGVVGDNIAYTQEFYIKGISDDSINYTLHLRFADGSVNSIIPDITRVDGDSTTLRWIVKKNDIFMHGYFEVQIEGVNSTGLVFQTEIVKLYADESIPIEDKEFENPNSETLKLREEAYEMVKKLDDASDLLEGTDLTSIENTTNKVTSFEANFIDKDNKKYPTIVALINFLKDYYYDISDVDEMMESMKIDEDGNLSVTLPSWNGEEGETLVIGKISGKDGADGADGYTPIKGTDYWTDTDKGEIIAEANEIISQQLADLTQVEPNFANSIDECIDTSKVYILPDGYIYAYVKTSSTKEVDNYTNQILLSTDTDGNLYNNGQGWKADTRLNSSGREVEYTDIECTGFIPAKKGDVIRFKNITYPLSGTDTNASQQYLATYDSDKKILNSVLICSATTEYAQTDNNGNVTSIVLGYDGSAWDNENIAYFRISAKKIDDTSIVTVNEEITTTTTTVTEESFKNTGHAFVQSDNEDRVIALEDTTSDHEIRLDKLEISGVEVTDSIPDYVKEEADRVATNVIAHQNENTLTFIACSDAHHSVVNTSMSTQMDESIKHCGQGMKLIRDKVHIDFVAMLGDVVWEYTETKEDVLKAYRTFNSYIADAFQGVQNFSTKGNHDCMSIAPPRLSESETFANIGIYNSGAIYDSANKASGYCYKDFEEFKIRVVCLNTSEGQDCNFNISDTQIAWFETVLDVSILGDSWKTILLSHHPLDWGGNNTEVMTTIKNLDNILCAFHGHVHGFKVDNMGDTQIKRIAIPNACFYRNNEYGQNGTTENADGTEFGEETTYTKTANSAEDTAFCVITIDLSAGKVYADHYGAGYDREVEI